jgi:archaetidylinositol phosphate synthase
MGFNLATEPNDSWTHRVARVLVRPLVGGPITANHLTTVRLLSGIAACVALGIGQRRWDIWGGVLWVVSAFFDRADGELARLSGTTTQWGHRYDYVCDVAVNGLVFCGIGVGLRESALGWWAVPMGILSGVSVVVSSLLAERLEQRDRTGKKAYSGIAGFDFDDILYLFGPIAWLGWLLPLLVGATVGAPAFAVWTVQRLCRSGSAEQSRSETP